MPATKTPDSSLADFPARLRALRQRAGMTQIQLEAATGIAQPTISDYESGRMMPSWRIMERLARGLGVRLGELVDPA
jgi:transcriptional regulator with XRE-family HTH domain